MQFARDPYVTTFNPLQTKKDPEGPFLVLKPRSLGQQGLDTPLFKHSAFFPFSSELLE
jgi:hypothetical protein